jgi:formylglycine-generating enzyme required for sulfatase activity
MNSKSVLIFTTALAAMATFADPDSPQATLVSVTQSQSMREVIATYTLDEPAIITFDVKTNGVSIGAANFGEVCGDVYRVVQPTEQGEVRTICWAAERACKGKQLAAGSVTFEVNAYATNSPPDYMVISLTTNDGYPFGTRTYYTAPEQLPGEGGVTNRKYKTDYLVMRRIPAKNAIFPMGYIGFETAHAPYHRVKLTNDFYMAVYELTRGQYKNIRGENCSLSWIDPAEGDFYQQRGLIAAQGTAYAADQTVPVPQQRYTSFRGSTKTWQTDGHDIDSGCELQTFRTVLGIPTLDLPTDAEWEFACRAGTSGDRFNGTTAGSVPNGIAWALSNTPKIEGATKPLPQEVGLLLPNPFGLYDIFGNVPEICLDYYNEGAAFAAHNPDTAGEPVVAPSGASTDKNGNAGNSSAIHIVRGGGVWNGDDACAAWARSYNQRGASSNEPIFGYRLVCLP